MTDNRNPDTVPWKELKVLGFCSHRGSSYPTDRRWLACFSNWYSSDFVLTEEDETENQDPQEDNNGNNQDNQDANPKIKFLMVEQWMMWKKARRYGDQESADMIMASTDPAEMKRLGRAVRGYDHHDWCNARYNIVLRGVRAKFAQKQDLREFLLNTQDQTLAEAATYDRVWGIGLHRTDPRTQDENQWQGLNLLGKALMEVRTDLQK